MEEQRKKLEDSLDIIGEVFKDIKEACVEGHFKIETSRLVEAGEVNRCIKLYVILKDIKKLTGRKLEVLTYYLILGYSKDTKKFILKGLDITDSNLNNINHELRKMGVIKSVGYNQSNNEVNEDLLAFKKFIVDKKGSYILIKID
ncbi:MAG: hypothetical protein ACJAVA_000357 [Flavobacteriaceae bacterium]|jgi:hypothetical protein